MISFSHINYIAAINMRVLRSKGMSPWATLKELVPLASFFVTVSQLGQYRRTLMILSYRLYLLVRDSGPTMACQYLKESVRLVAKWLSGHPDLVVRPGTVLVARDSRGLPKIIPPFLRNHIVDRKVAVIKGVLTILSFYRVVKAPMIIKLHTITAGYQGTVPVESVYGEVNMIMNRFWSGMSFDNPFSWLFSVSAGPNGSHSTWFAPLDAVGFITRPRLLFCFAQISPWYVTWYIVALGLWFLPVALWRFALELLLRNQSQRPRQKKDLWPILGRLHVKEEAAGKARVFAITDWWTQGLFAGLSRWISEKILSRIHQDGTHDQHAPLNSLKER